MMRPLLVAALLAAGPAWAGKPGRKDEQAVRALHDRYARSVELGDWHGAAALMHPDALARFRGLLGDLLGVEGPDGITMGQALLGARPEELQQLDDASFYASFFDTMTKLVPDFRAAMAGSRMDTRTVSFDASGEAYVVYDMTMDTLGIEVHKLGVTSARRTEDGTWGFLLAGDIVGLAQGFRAQLEALQQSGQVTTPPVPEPAP